MSLLILCIPVVYVLSMYKKWEICDVVLEGITHETRATLESMCYGALCLLNADDMWDLLESLSSYQWQCECASKAFVYPSPPPHDFHDQSPCADQIRDACDHYSFSPLDACSYCQSFDHDVNSYPSYDVLNDLCDRLTILMETIKEEQDQFVSKMGEFSLLQAIDPGLPIPRLESNLHDDYASSLPPKV